MTPPGLLRAGNSLKCCYLRRSLSLVRKEAHSTALQWCSSFTVEVAVKPWQCFGNSVANSIHGAGREAQRSLYGAAVMIEALKGLQVSQTLFPSPGRDPQTQPSGPYLCPISRLCCCPTSASFHIPVSGSATEAVWDIFPLPSRR